MTNSDILPRPERSSYYVEGMTPQQHIANIREKKFGLKPDGSCELNPLNEDLHNGCKNLADELYAKDTHFILELIQNAEDNQYAPGVKPSLIFRLLENDPTGTPGADGALVVVNNEIGFAPENVEALCAVGRTTKQKRQGYIGEKGIGFKSVFRVSSRPHIISRGYQFYFTDSTTAATPLGYIIPLWLSEVPAVLRPYRDRTCIVLPLRSGERQKVSQELEHISPETILFLSKLDSITIEVEGRSLVEVCRQQIREHLTRLTIGDRSFDFWLAHQEMAIPSELHEEKRLGIDTRIVSVALPLSEPKPSHLVFAFLPTEISSGLPFLVNADFILSSSRETIQYDRPWNIWLRDCIAEVFIEAFETLLHEPSYRYIAYQFIPLLENIPEEFFRPVAKSIQQLFQERPVVWTKGDSKPKLPIAARLAHQNFRDLLRKAKGIPERMRATPLVHPRLERYERQLRAIGVKSISEGEILSCLNDEKWMGQQEISWFIDLYHYLKEHSSWATPGKLKPLKLLPIEGGSLASADEQRIYFSPRQVLNLEELFQAAQPFLHPCFLRSALEAELDQDKSLRDWLISTFAFSELTIGQFCLDLARALQEHRASVDTPTLIRITRYIRDHSEHFDEGQWRDLKNTLPLLLDSGEIIVPARDSRSHSQDGKCLVVPAALDPETGWSLVFPDPQDRADLFVLSDVYLVNSSLEEIEKWKRFFLKLGATDIPPPRYRKWDLDRYGPPQDLPESTREALQKVREYSTWETLEDFVAPTWLCRLDEPGHVLERRARALVNWLSRRQEVLHEYGSARYFWGYYSYQTTKLLSNFAFCLQNEPWFPSTQGFKRPQEVFLARAEIQEVLGDAVPYTQDEIPEKVADFLGIHQTATREEVLKYLKQLAAGSPESVKMETMQKIYTFLAERWQDDLRAEFKAQPLILCQKPQPRWVTADECVWPDLSAVFGELYAYLERDYPSRLREFFVDKIGVRSQLDPELYAQAWQQLSDRADVRPEDVEAALERVLPVLRSVLRSSADKRPGWWSRFCSSVKVWTHRRRFEPVDRVFLTDDRHLHDRFADRVGFAWIPRQATWSDYQSLFEAIGVRSAARSVHVQVVPPTETLSHKTDFQPRLTPEIKRAVCIYLRNETPEHYTALKEQGHLESFVRTETVPTRNLRVRYELAGVVSDDMCAAFWDREHLRLYCSVERDRAEVRCESAATLARQLGSAESGSGLEDFIARIMAAPDEIETIIRMRNWTFPQDEEQWIAAILRPTPLLEVSETISVEFEAKHIGEAGWREADVRARSAATPISLSGSPSPHRHVSREDRTRCSLDRCEIAPAGKSENFSDTGRPRDRLRSYVLPQDAHDTLEHHEESSGIDTRRREIEDAGIWAACEYERLQGRIPKVLERTHRGWDINCYEQEVEDSAMALPIRRIEVKALEGAWDGWGVGLTPTEYRYAREHGENYYLYVVEYALDVARRRLYVFKDPVRKIIDYRLDDGWKNAADESS